VPKHQNIVNMLKYCSRDSPFIVSEYMNNGTLSNFLGSYRTNDETQEKLALSEKSLINFSIQIANGINFLHENNIYHPDLAACNILVSENLTMKIMDIYKSEYGNGSYYKGSFKTSHGRSPYLWQPPETLTDNKLDGKSNSYDNFSGYESLNFLTV
jgi:serine/threonine protein kinase